jgi:hypothetical protein
MCNNLKIINLINIIIHNNKSFVKMIKLIIIKKD